MVPMPWEQQPGESSQAFASFAVYRDLGPYRSLVKVGQKNGKSRGILEKLSRENNWVDRARAWDAHEDDVRREAHLAALAEMTARHANMAKLVISRCLNRLLAMADPKDPKRIIERIDLKDLARLMDVAVKVERLARGASTDTLELTGKDGGAIQHEHDLASSASERLASLIGGIVAPREKG